MLNDLIVMPSASSDLMDFPKSRIRKVVKIIWCPKVKGAISFDDCIKSDCCIEYDLELEKTIRCSITRQKHIVKVRI